MVRASVTSGLTRSFIKSSILCCFSHWSFVVLRNKLCYGCSGFSAFAGPVIEPVFFDGKIRFGGWIVETQNLKKSAVTLGVRVLGHDSIGNLMSFASSGKPNFNHTLRGKPTVFPLIFPFP